MMKSHPMNRTRREQSARVLRALAHPLRLQILQELNAGEETAARLLARLGCSQSMLSQQLKILEHQGLIESRKAGTCKVCRMRNPNIMSLFDCLQRHLENTGKGVRS